MRTIGRTGVRAALLVGFTLALGTPAAPCGFDDVEHPSGSPSCHPCPVRQFAGEGDRDAMMC